MSPNGPSYVLVGDWATGGFSCPSFLSLQLSAPAGKSLQVSAPAGKLCTDEAISCNALARRCGLESSRLLAAPLSGGLKASVAP